MPTILKLEAVSKSYGNVSVLNDLDLAIEDGESLALLSPSGSGKTTVLRLIGGFEDITAGRILLDGRDISGVPINRRPFHTVFQDYALFPHMSVAANVGYGLSVRGTAKAELNRRVGDALELVQLGKLAGRYPAQLSGGQRQRVALARAIVCEPRLVLLDEPLAALDFELRHQMQDFLKDIQRRIKTTFVFVTHDQEEAMNVADRICVMQAGKIEQIGSAKDLYRTPRTEFVARFSGENNLIPADFLQAAGDGVKVRTAIGEFTCNSDGTPSAANGIVAIRPEALRFGAAATENRFAARVRESRFAGAAVALRLEAGPSSQPVEIKVRVPAGSPLPSEGEEITMGFQPSDGYLVAS